MKSGRTVICRPYFFIFFALRVLFWRLSMPFSCSRASQGTPKPPRQPPNVTQKVSYPEAFFEFFSDIILSSTLDSPDVILTGNNHIQLDISIFHFSPFSVCFSLLFHALDPVPLPTFSHHISSRFVASHFVSSRRISSHHISSLFRHFRTFRPLLPPRMPS